MKVSEVIKTILSRLRNSDIALFTTGLISREAFAVKDRPQNFYMLGSMGLVSSIGLGIALNTSKKVVIFDGDGSLLMDLGAMATISSQKPDNLFHIVLDNEAYESTGNQPTVSKDIDLAEIAKAAGYRTVYKFCSFKQLKSKITTLLNQKGPVFILLKLKVSDDRVVPPRVSVSPLALTERTKRLF